MITLPDLTIIDYVVGHTGSAHDNWAFQDSVAVLNSRDLVSEEECIWGDSAYALTSHVIAPYKLLKSLHPDNKRFNYYLSSIRVRSEHAIGFLKERFGSLNGLRQNVRNPMTHKLALIGVKTCIVLHMLAYQMESREGGEVLGSLEDWIQDEAEETEEGEMRLGVRDNEDRSINCDTALFGTMRRESLKAQLLASFVNN